MNTPTFISQEIDAKRVYEVSRVVDHHVLGTRITAEPECYWLEDWLASFHNEESEEDLMYRFAEYQGGRLTWWRNASSHDEMCERCDGAGAYCHSMSRAIDGYTYDDCEKCGGTGWIDGPKPDYLNAPVREKFQTAAEERS